MLVCIPRITIKEVALTATSFSHTPSSTNRIISAILHIYQRFFIISTVRHRISTYRQFSATYLCSIPCHYNKRSYPTATSFPHTHFVFTKIYQRFFKYIDHFSTYINDFSLYQRFNTRYRFNDNLRHSKRTIYPIPKQLTAELYD